MNARIVYFSHGGGPLPILGDPGHRAMINFMTDLPTKIPKPEAIVVISAHWEETVPTCLGAGNPPMFYDYYGFPQEAYKIKYQAPGNPGLAGRIVKILKEHSIKADIDQKRGFDHGLFIPLKMMYPEADIPSIQLSLVEGLNSAKHIQIGKALSELKNESILVIGSGFSFHNMRAFSWDGEHRPDHDNDAFQSWLVKTITLPMTEGDRENQLIEWEKAPHARYCHPREEHLLPLHVCQGMAGTPGKLIFDDKILGKRSVAFLWE